MTAAELKSHYKKVYEGVPASPERENWGIRTHRAISWLARAEKLEGNADLAEAQLLYLWISFNSLYAAWDPMKNAPCIDSQRMHAFISELFQIGGGGELPKLLDSARPAVKRLMQNRYISAIFWRNPHSPDQAALKAELTYMDQNYKAHDYARLLRQVIDRIYVLRGQIVHGASTGGGKLNRNSISDCSAFMRRFVPVVVQLVIERGATAQWPEVCYPPVK